MFKYLAKVMSGHNFKAEDINFLPTGPCSMLFSSKLMFPIWGCMKHWLGGGKQHL